MKSCEMCHSRHPEVILKVVYCTGMTLGTMGRQQLLCIKSTGFFVEIVNCVKGNNVEVADYIF